MMNRFRPTLPLTAAALGLILALAGCRKRPEPTPPPVAPPALKSLTPMPTPKAPEPRRERIFFLKGDASLSPGALKKLKAWTVSWGAEGTWVLACPADTTISSGLRERRLQVLRAQLQKHGVRHIEVQSLPAEKSGRHDAVYLLK